MVDPMFDGQEDAADGGEAAILTPSSPQDVRGPQGTGEPAAGVVRHWKQVATS